MELTKLLGKISTKINGQFFNVHWITRPTLRSSAKKAGIIVEKEVFGTIRKGIRYENIKSVRERLEHEGKFHIDPITNEIVIEIQPLPWGEYVSKYEGLLIKNKDKYYVRVYSTPNHARVKYYLNGKEISKEDLIKEDVVIPSYWNNQSPQECMTVSVENIVEIY